MATKLSLPTEEIYPKQYFDLYRGSALPTKATVFFAKQLGSPDVKLKDTYCTAPPASQRQTFLCGSRELEYAGPICFSKNSTLTLRLGQCNVSFTLHQLSTTFIRTTSLTADCILEFQTSNQRRVKWHLAKQFDLNSVNTVQVISAQSKLFRLDLHSLLECLCWYPV